MRSRFAHERLAARVDVEVHAELLALLELMAQKAVDELASEVQPEGELLDVDEWMTEFTQTVFAKLRENPRLSGNVVRLMPAGSLVEVLRKPLERLCERELCKRGLAVEEGHGYVLSFFIGGLCATYETWIAHGQGDAALDEAASLIARAATQGVGGLLKPV